MKFFFTVMAASFSLFYNAAAFEAKDGFGVGVVLGSPSGLSASLPLGEDKALNFLIGYDLAGQTNLHLQADYVWHQYDFVPVEAGRVSLYYGPGAFASLSGHSTASIHAVVGIDYLFQSAPVELFLEVSPGINVLPDTDINTNGGLGVRYFF